MWCNYGLACSLQRLREVFHWICAIIQTTKSCFGSTEILQYLVLNSLYIVLTVKSQFVAAATNFLGNLLVRPLFEGGYYLSAAIISPFQHYNRQYTVKSLLRAAALILFGNFRWGSYSRAALNWGRLLIQKYQKITWNWNQKSKYSNKVVILVPN